MLHAGQFTKCETTSLSMAFICAVVDSFPFEIDHMCSDLACEASVMCIPTTIYDKRHVTNAWREQLSVFSRVQAS